MKGHVQIQLKNERTGQVEVHEQDNMVTNAVAKVLGLAANMELVDFGSSDKSQMRFLLPIGEKALGGIFLFDGALKEDVDNVHFPMDVHLTGSAGHVENTESKLVGSLNVMESGRTDAGYVNTWEFSTSQANGVIGALALTHYKGGSDPAADIKMTNSYIYAYDRGYVQIAYDAQKGILYLYRQGIIYSRKMFSDVLRTGTPYTEDIESVFDFAFTNPTYESWGVSNGYDGYLYAVYISNKNPGIDVRVRKVKISDMSFQEEAEKDFTINEISTLEHYNTSSNATDFFDMKAAVSMGQLYLTRSNKKSIYKINLDNTADIKEIEFKDEEVVGFCPLYNGGVLVRCRRTVVNSSGSKTEAYFLGKMYPDGNIIYSNNGVSSNIGVKLGLQGDNLYLGGFKPSSSYRPDCGYSTDYLGTICNLSSPVVKTSEQSMKITYTLTDV